MSQAPILPPLVLPESPPDANRRTERIEGTRLVPPPAAQSSGVRGTGNISRTETLPLIGPQRGALPPTSDPMSSREPN